MMVLISDMNIRGGDFLMYYYNFLFFDNVVGINCFLGGKKIFCGFVNFCNVFLLYVIYMDGVNRNGLFFN